MYPALQPVTAVHHGAVRFAHNGTVVYVDPYQQKDAPQDASLILISHAHGDHYHPESLRKLINPNTLFVAGANVAAALQTDLAIPAARISSISTNGYTEPLPGVSVQALAAENKNHPAGTGFGFLLAFAGYRYYLSGDTDTLDKDAICDVLFCVCDGKYNMPDYLNRAPAQIQAMHTPPGLVVPYHFSNGLLPDHGEKLVQRLNELGITATLPG